MENHPNSSGNGSRAEQGQSGFLMAAPQATPIPSIQRRTVDGARQLRDNFNSVMREIQPLVETARHASAQVNAISMTSFLNRSQSAEGIPPHQHHHHHHQHAHPIYNSAPNLDNNSFVINLENFSGPEGTHPQNITAEPRAEAADNTGTNNNPEPNPAGLDENAQLAEAQELLKILLKYVPFIFILLAKCLFDYHWSLFILSVLFLAFYRSNSVVKRETIKRHRRGLGTLFVELIYIVTCFVFIRYVFADELHNFNVVMNLVLIRTFSHPLTVGSLLWIMTVTDYILKLITVAVKILLTMLPGRVIAFQKRGKIYLFVEALSQMYRSMVTIQPWLNYLMESYQGPQKIVAVFLSAFYMIAKGTDLISKVKLLKTASFKLLQNVTVGSSPSKEQIQTAGEHCPICHDEYDSPVLLQCRHIFCENCVTTWFDREQTCPLCRAKIVDDPSWRDGSTSHFVQLF